MELSSSLLQFLASLIAILLLAALARWLGLGKPMLLETDEAVAKAAGEIRNGFGATAMARCRSGKAALARGENGEILVMRTHGSKIVGRVLTPESSARQIFANGANFLQVDCGEPHFGAIDLELDDPGNWEAAINALREASNA